MFTNSLDHPDLRFLLFDVGSDIYNGKSFIDGGNPVWGSIIIGVTFLPMTAVYVFLAMTQYCDEKSSKPKKILILPLALILAPLVIPIMTVGYIGYVAYVFLSFVAR